MQTFFYLLDQNVVLEPAREVLPGLWVGRHSGAALEHLAQKHRSLVLVDQKELRKLSGTAVEHFLAHRHAPAARQQQSS
ncbi:hypothetical protein KEM63_10250 [Halopseudomonas nanhaiensis]|uniref:hypothetical protein n=1 Tax=Halopseudomonas nanhaiensis TaxID=2830842 RepID=UPI001CBE2CDA|nr:hypothetical protein [Halopseudomonas nanhaiensis]UAW97211.1 hypothetical protein KEM63_10250 [Halopseudomonas nanhaiensis]